MHDYFAPVNGSRLTYNRLQTAGKHLQEIRGDLHWKTRLRHHRKEVGRSQRRRRGHECVGVCNEESVSASILPANFPVPMMSWRRYRDLVDTMTAFSVVRKALTYCSSQDRKIDQRDRGIGRHTVLSCPIERMPCYSGGRYKVVPGCVSSHV